MSRLVSTPPAIVDPAAEESAARAVFTVIAPLSGRARAGMFIYTTARKPSRRVTALGGKSGGAGVFRALRAALRRAKRPLVQAGDAWR